MLYLAQPWWQRPVFAFVISLAFAACTGTVKPGETPADNAPPGADNPGAGGPGAVVSAGSLSAGPRLLRRLTRAEYDNTIRDLLKDTSKPARAFPADVPDESGFLNPATVGGVETSRFAEAAEASAVKAVAKLDTLVGCNVAANGEQKCAETFIAAFGERAFRAPVPQAQVKDLLGLYVQVRAAPLNYSFSDAIRVLVTAMLQSPRFLYHWESEAAPPKPINNLVQLGDFQTASRLSYFLWQSMPDDELLANARQGKLRTSSQVEAQARRLLKDPRAKDAIFEFHSQWLHLETLATLDKDAKVYPGWTASLAQDMEAEVRAFVTQAVLEDGKLETLLLSRKSVVSPQLAAHYGLPAGAGANVTLPEDRAGLFTLAGFLATAASTYETSPVKRGKLVRERLLCERIPPPPPSADITPPNAAALGVSTREAYRVHAENPMCKSCHEMMDGLGFAFEGFDGIGKSRRTDAGKPVDSSGTLTGLAGTNASYKNAREMLEVLVNQEETQRCLVKQWFRFAAGHTEVDQDETSLERAYQAFKAKQWDLREAIVSLATSSSFRYRTIFTGEVNQ